MDEGFFWGQTETGSTGSLCFSVNFRQAHSAVTCLFVCRGVLPL